MCPHPPRDFLLLSQHLTLLSLGKNIEISVLKLFVEPLLSAEFTTNSAVCILQAIGKKISYSPKEQNEDGNSCEVKRTNKDVSIEQSHTNKSIDNGEQLSTAGNWADVPISNHCHDGDGEK